MLLFYFLSSFVSFFVSVVVDCCLLSMSVCSQCQFLIFMVVVAADLNYISNGIADAVAVAAACCWFVLCHVCFVFLCFL